ncbi:tetracycline resistance protein [Rhizoctonia solani]|uniref:Tetracycline resistance protein n=1 Tax=Rhizoctonia solani TaxID=456999 RepID=A0A8H7I806_9AGAM|nr:tetracycline resistance protein [Rhizoctonia solani]
MDSKVTLEGSVPITPTVSLDHDPRRESVEMTVFNRSHTEADQINSPKDTIVSTHLDDTAAHRKEMIAMAAVCWTQFMAGWNDGTLGPLIPTIQEHFHANWVYDCFYALRVRMLRLYYRSYCRDLFYRQIWHYTTFSCHVCGINDQRDWHEPPECTDEFPGYFIDQESGYKNGNDACGLRRWACVSPLIATQFSQMPRWSFYFLVSLGLAVSNTVSQSLVFGFRTLPEMLTSFGIPEVVHTADSTQTSKYRQILNIKVIYVLAFFALLYVGTEVTIGGWIVTFLIENRGEGLHLDTYQGNDLISMHVFRKAAQCLSQFEQSGLMLGRSYSYGEPKGYAAILRYLCVCLIKFQSILSYSYESVGGFVPAWLLTGAISWIASSGMSGSAIFPFITGVIAKK